MDEPVRPQASKLLHERWTRLGISGLLGPERDYALLWSLHVETSSGGLDQYLCNTSGDYADDTVAALERYGQDELASVLRRAMEALPGGWCAERSERERRLAAVPERWDVFRALDGEYERAVAAAAERESREPRPDGGVFNALLAAYRREGLLVEPDA